MKLNSRRLNIVLKTLAYMTVENRLIYSNIVVIFNMVTRRILMFDLETIETCYDPSSPFLIRTTNYIKTGCISFPSSFLCFPK